MAEDSGAFKTNPANSRQVPAFVKFRNAVAEKPHRFRKRTFEYERGIDGADF
jgi:hypothetical protein